MEKKLDKKIGNVIIKKFKNLVARLPKISGRSNGKVVIRHRGGSNKRCYRFIDYRRSNPLNEQALIINYFYCSKPRNHLSTICFSSGLMVNILNPNKVMVGEIVQNYANFPNKPGDSGRLGDIPYGSLIHGISLRPKGVGVLTRSSGCSSVLIRTDENASLVKLRSGELRLINIENTASMGSIGDDLHFLSVLGKAGSSRHIGRRPIVRAYAKNPVDHPMGGRTKGGTQSLTPQGRLLKNKSTKKYFHQSILQTKRSQKFKK